MMFKKCIHCGANLDSGERCDCQRFKTDTEFLKSLDEAPAIDPIVIGSEYDPFREVYHG